MKILFPQVFPYHDAGPKVRSYYVPLSRRKHDVSLVSFVRGTDTEALSHVRSYCHVHTVRWRFHHKGSLSFLTKVLRAPLSAGLVMSNG